jgi:hypothetical protein
LCLLYIIKKRRKGIKDNHMCNKLTVPYAHSFVSHGSRTYHYKMMVSQASAA